MTVLQFVVPRGEAYKQSPMQIVEQSAPTQKPELVVNTTLSYVIVPVGPWTTAHQGGSQHWHWTGGLFWAHRPNVVVSSRNSASGILGITFITDSVDRFCAFRAGAARRGQWFESGCPGR